MSPFTWCVNHMSSALQPLTPADFLQPFITFELFESLLSVSKRCPTIVVLGQRSDARTIYAFARIALPSPLSSAPSALLRSGLRDASSAASRAHVSTRSPSSCFSFLPPTGRPPQLANIGPAPATKSNLACCQALQCCASSRAGSVAHSWFGKLPGMFSDPAASPSPTFFLFRTAPEHLGPCPWHSYGSWQRTRVPLSSSRVEPQPYDLGSFGRQFVNVSVFGAPQWLCLGTATCGYAVWS